MVKKLNSRHKYIPYDVDEQRLFDKIMSFLETAKDMPKTKVMKVIVMVLERLGKPLI